MRTAFGKQTIQNLKNLKLNTEMENFLAGEVCGRNGCDGVISEHDIIGGCSCHINPPCSYCVTPKAYCPKCGWDAKEDNEIYNDAYKPSQEDLNKWAAEREHRDNVQKEFDRLYRGNDPVEKYDERHEFHTHFTMIKYGVYPPSMTKEDVRKRVDGSFGGRFERFCNGRFKFIAYTD